jgi:hypothetical protein
MGRVTLAPAAASYGALCSRVGLGHLIGGSSRPVIRVYTPLHPFWQWIPSQPDQERAQLLPTLAAELVGVGQVA